MRKISKIAISSAINGRIFAMPVFDDGSVGDAHAFDSEDEARAFVAMQYPNAKTTRVGGGTSPKNANQRPSSLQE
ncbi:hypothetical protein Tamer19_43230 [Cupriavidus sp. TA19]|uniref:hypothetical protein n=1 Tax=unclassified Cupriavidus TaxID=2640874 RepID=UPI0027294AF6|nr:hypothetical protein [Cupriavidus sp. TA19]GLC94915.1 hypothetical protein Tamer19_43230 [Cupriavidus sp. TA19]